MIVVGSEGTFPLNEQVPCTYLLSGCWKGTLRWEFSPLFCSHRWGVSPRAYHLAESHLYLDQNELFLCLISKFSFQL